MWTLLFALGLYFLRSDTAAAAPIHDYAKTGDVQALKTVLDTGIDVDESDGRATPLYYAVTKGHVEAVKLLVSRGADVNRNTSWGPPIINAAWNCKPDILKLLLAKGAKPNAVFKSDTALHMAAERGQLDCVRLLVEAGADVNALNRFREPPIHLAKKKGAEDVVHYLLNQGYITPAPAAIVSKLGKARSENGEAVFIRECRNCHDAGPEQRIFRGPPLWNILGRDIASVRGFNYSPVLKDEPGRWDYEKLNVYLSDPARTIPGNDMGSNGIQNEAERVDLIIFLRQRSDVLFPLP
jgi:cytochrome c